MEYFMSAFLLLFAIFLVMDKFNDTSFKFVLKIHN